MNNRTLLIVESNPQISQKLKENFQKDNFIVHCAIGYQDALEAVDTFQPALIISEVLLNDGDGIQLCKTIKEDTRSWHIPFIFLTSANDTLIEIKCLRSGADDFFVKKNVTRQELIIKIEVLLEKNNIYNRYGRCLEKPLMLRLKDLRMKKLLKIAQVIEFSGIIFFYTGNDSAQIIVENGMVKNANINTIEGLDAIFKIDKLKEAYVSFNTQKLESYNNNIDQSTETIISLLDN